MATKQKHEPSRVEAGARRSVEASKREMPTAGSLERDAPEALADATVTDKPHGGARADNGSD